MQLTEMEMKHVLKSLVSFHHAGMINDMYLLLQKPRAVIVVIVLLICIPNSCSCFIYCCENIVHIPVHLLAMHVVEMRFL